jgi:signal transduction histidine kinase
MIRVLDVAAVSVVLHDEEKDDMYFAAASGEGADLVMKSRLELGRGIAGRAVQSGESLLVPDVSQEPSWYGGLDAKIGFETRSILCVPLRGKDRIIGALEAINKEDGFTQDDLHLLSALATPVAAAIENARLFEQVNSGRQHLQALSRRLVEVQEAERAHVARELHDETGQALSSLLLILSLLEEEDRLEKVAERVVEMEGLVEGLLENLHRLAMNLRPVTLDYLGLVPALDQFVESFERQNGIVARFEAVGLDGERLPPETETALYRIVQEALTNAQRHATAGRVDVLLQRHSDGVIAIVEDDGIGFDPEAARQNSRLGLFGMRERAQMLGGTLTIESHIGEGTSIIVEIPHVRVEKAVSDEHSYSNPDR